MKNSKSCYIVEVGGKQMPPVSRLETAKAFCADIRSMDSEAVIKIYFMTVVELDEFGNSLSDSIDE